MALILDGTSPTAAWSMYRDLLTSFVGNTRYTTATGVNSLNDQSGNARNLVQTTGASQPGLTTAGPNSRACAAFDGVDDGLVATGFPISSFISANSGYVVISFIADSITAASGTVYNNNCVFEDAAAYMGVFMQTPNVISSYNYDGSVETANGTITIGTLYVAEWRHDSGSLYLRINGGTETSVASGNTGSMTGVLRLGTGSGANANIKAFELATYSTVPLLATRNAIVADFMAQGTGGGGGTTQARAMVLA